MSIWHIHTQPAISKHLHSTIRWLSYKMQAKDPISLSHTPKACVVDKIQTESTNQIFKNHWHHQLCQQHVYNNQGNTSLREMKGEWDKKKYKYCSKAYSNIRWVTNYNLKESIWHNIHSRCFLNTYSTISLSLARAHTKLALFKHQHSMVIELQNTNWMSWHIYTWTVFSRRIHSSRSLSLSHTQCACTPPPAPHTQRHTYRQL